MDHGQKVKLLKKLDVTDLAGEKVMIDFDSGKYFMLKGAANDIWDLMNEEESVDDIVSSLCVMYDVEESVCLSSTVEFLRAIEKLGFIRIEA